MTKVFLGANKIYSQRKIYTAEELVNSALPHVVKVYKDEDFAGGQPKLKFGTQMLSTGDGVHRLYSYQEFYASLFQFDEQEVTDHLERNDGSMEGFSGTNPKVMADWFVADFDSPDGIKGVIPNLSKALMYFDAHKIPYYIYASGKKGMHLYIPMNVFVIPEQYKTQMHVVFSSIADWMEEEFNWEHGFIDRLYDPVRMFRFPFSLHPSSGLIKTIALFKSDKYNPAAEIKQYLSVEKDIDKDTAVLLRRPLFIPYEGKIYKTIEITPKEKPVYENSPADIVNKTFITPRGERMCVYSMLNASNIEGQRRKVALVIIFWLKEKGLPEDLAFRFMEYWSSKLTKPLTHNELLDVMKYYGRYRLSCSHEDMRRYCPENNTCVHWKNEILSKKVHDLKDSLSETLALANETNETRFHLDEFISAMPGFSSTKYGHIGAIAAASGVGKTWLALALMSNVKRLNFLFFSYEQSRHELLLRVASLKKLDINNPEESDMLLAEMSNIYIDDSGTTTLDQQLQVKRSLEEKHGIKIHVVVVDYIQLALVEDHNNPGKYINNQTQAMVEVSRRIKTDAKKDQYSYIFLSQVPKAVSGNGNTMITSEDMKDSQALEASCDWILTMWRPYKGLGNREDNVVSILLSKHKHITNSWKLQHHYFTNGEIGEQTTELVDVRERRI